MLVRVKENCREEKIMTVSNYAWNDIREIRISSFCFELSASASQERPLRYELEDNPFAFTEVFLRSWNPQLTGTKTRIIRIVWLDPSR